MGQTSSSIPLSQGCFSISLDFEDDKPMLSAQCRILKGELGKIGLPSAGPNLRLKDFIDSHDSRFPLDLVLGNNDGNFAWGLTNFSETADDIRLEGTLLRATLETANGDSLDASFDLVDYLDSVGSAMDLDLVLGNVDGKFVWGSKGFSKTAKHVRLEGTKIRALLETVNEQWKDATFDLDEMLFNNRGKLQARGLPMVLAVPLESSREVVNQLQSSLQKNPDAEIFAIDRPDGSTAFIIGKAGTIGIDGGKKTGADPDDATVGYYNAEINMTEQPNAVFNTIEASARASVFHVAKETGHSIRNVSADFITVVASAGVGGMNGGEGAGFPAYLGANAAINLVELKASAFDLNLGLGVETGVGFKNYSFDIHAVGCGFTIGKKVSVSVFGSGFGIDFGRFFD